MIRFLRLLRSRTGSFVMQYPSNSHRSSPSILGIIAANRSISSFFASIPAASFFLPVYRDGAALSNKVPLYRTFAELGLTEATATPELIADAMAVNSVAMLTLGTAGSTAGWIPLNYPLLIVKKGGGSTHVMFEAQTQGGGGGPLYRGYYNKNATYGNKWTGWTKISTATPPQEYDLPLAEGCNPYPASAGNQWACTYSKDQFGIVRLCARLTTQNAIAATGTLIATIPAGFRPLKAFSVVCRVQLPGSGSQILTIADVDMYGQIKLFNVEANANSGTVSLVLPPCSFVAAD